MIIVQHMKVISRMQIKINVFHLSWMRKELLLKNWPLRMETAVASATLVYNDGEVQREEVYDMWV